MSKEMPTRFSREEVQRTMHRVEPQESYSEVVQGQLEETVFGQPDATKAVARRLALFDTGLTDPHRPLGSMVFLGPSGVGKTEMAHAAAKVMFGDTHSDRLKVINMAEMQEHHYVSRFVGSPPGYVDHDKEGEIPHAWLNAGRSIIVLDEFEKAHPDVRQLFLGALDKGIMNTRGKTGTEPLNFSNTLFIITSNIAGQEIHNITQGTGQIGFRAATPSQERKHSDMQKAAEKGLKAALSPEFLNRIDDVVVFSEIRDRAVHAKIFDKFIAYRNHDLVGARGAEAPFFAVTEEFREHILDEVGNLGGREMKRQLEREMFDKAADVFMGLDVRGRPLVADWNPEEGGVVFYTDDNPPILEAEKKGTALVPTTRDPLSNSPSQPTEPTKPKSPSSGDSGSKTQEVGGAEEPNQETPPEEPEFPGTDSGDLQGPIDQHGDPGDENDSRGRHMDSPTDDELPPDVARETSDLLHEWQSASKWRRQQIGAELQQRRPNQEPPKPPERVLVGVRVTIWDESMVEEDGSVRMSLFEQRNISLPKKNE